MVDHLHAFVGVVRNWDAVDIEEDKCQMIGRVVLFHFMAE
jgi:hypothetical protein